MCSYGRRTIGGASRVGAIGLATILIVRFGLHNMTEGFGIAAPLTAGARPSWAFFSLAGLIGGSPHVGRRFALREVAMWGVFLGFLAGYGTDLILAWGGT